MAGRWDTRQLWERGWNHPIGRAVTLAASALGGSAVYSAVTDGSAHYMSSLFLAAVAYVVSMRIAPPQHR